MRQLLPLLATAAAFHPVGRQANLVASPAGRQVARGATAAETETVDIAEKWGVRFEEQTAMRAGGYRFISRDNDYEVEALDGRVVLDRDGGLGLELAELADNGKGVGIVVIDALVPGGNAEREGSLRPGDVIIAVGAAGGSLARVEAKPWDATVGALAGVEGDRVEMIVKRLVRRPKVDIVLKMGGDTEDQRFSIFAGENLRQAMLSRGVKLNDPLARRFDSGGGGDCGAEGTCTTCAVAVLEGEELLSPAKTQEKQMLAKKPRWRLACKARAGVGGREGELVLRVNPRQVE